MGTLNLQSTKIRLLMVLLAAAPCFAMIAALRQHHPSPGSRQAVAFSSQLKPKARTSSRAQVPTALDRDSSREWPDSEPDPHESRQVSGCSTGRLSTSTGMVSRLQHHSQELECVPLDPESYFQNSQLTPSHAKGDALANLNVSLEDSGQEVSPSGAASQIATNATGHPHQQDPDHQTEVEESRLERERQEQEAIAALEVQQKQQQEARRLAAAAAESKRVERERQEQEAIAALEVQQKQQQEARRLAAAAESNRQERERQEQEAIAALEVQQKQQQEAKSAMSVQVDRTRKPSPAVVPVFNLGANSMGRSVQVAALKFERLIDSSSLPSFSGAGQGNTLQQVPPSSSFMVDVEKIVQRQREIRRLDVQIALNPSSADAFYDRANLHYSISSLDNASSDYSRSIELKPSNSAAWINRGAVRRKLGDVVGAIADYDQAINLSGSDPDAFRNRGIAREITGDMEGAISDWRRAASLGDPDSGKWIALASQKLGDHNIQILTRMHTSPDSVSPVLPLGKPLVMPASMDGRLNQLTIALMSKPSDPQLLFERGTVLLRQGRYSLAIDDFSVALKATPQSARLIFNRAVARRQSGDLQGAIIDYDKVLSITPRDRDAYRNRGIVRQLLGSLSAACADWGVALALGDKEVATWVRDECR